MLALKPDQGQKNHGKVVFLPNDLRQLLGQKSKKRYPKRYRKIDAEKVSKIDAKRLQNDVKMGAKMVDCSYFFEKGENAPDSLFSNIKRGSGRVKSNDKLIIFDRVAVQPPRPLSGARSQRSGLVTL